MAEPLRISFTIKLGLRKIDKATEIGLLIENTAQRVKAETGRGLNCSYFKRPWQTSMHVEIEGEIKTVKLFLNEFKTYADRLNLKISPENWFRI